MRLFAFVWKNDSPTTRSALTVVGLAVAVAAVVALVGISDSFSRHFRRFTNATTSIWSSSAVGSDAELNNGLPDAWATRSTNCPACRR